MEPAAGNSPFTWRSGRNLGTAPSTARGHGDFPCPARAIASARPGHFPSLVVELAGASPRSSDAFTVAAVGDTP